jgi:hypothetical protein
MHITFWIDLNMPAATDVLTEELRGTSESKIAEAWSPYESKMVSRLPDPLTTDEHTFTSILDVPPGYP